MLEKGDNHEGYNYKCAYESLPQPEKIPGK
jgi:hypothetical protein